MTDLDQILVRPVGYVSCSRTDTEDDRWDAETSIIRLVAGFGPQSLQGLTDFSHLEILFHFHRIEATTVTTGARHPRGNPAWPLTGIFAQRGCSRPNRLGTTVCRLVGIDGTAITVSGLDAIDGTPVLDIKPVMKEFLPRGPLTQPQWSGELMKDYWVPQR